MTEELYKLYLHTHATTITGRQITLDDMIRRPLEEQVVMALAAYDAHPQAVIRTRESLGEAVNELLCISQAKPPKKGKETLS